MTDLVSIIIPTYNRDRYILEALNSIKEQSYPYFECIIVDDGDSDTTANLLVDYINVDNRFKYYRRPKDWPKGANACRNYGLGLSQGQFIGFCDDDDFWLADKLEKQLAVFSENSDIGLVTGNIEFVNADGKRTGREIQQLNKNGFVFKEFLLKNKMSMITPLLKREIFDKVGDFNIDFHLYEDWEFWRRAAYYYKFYAIDAVLACVRRHDSNTYQINTKSPIKEFKLYSRLDKALKLWGANKFSKEEIKLIDDIRIKKYHKLSINQCPSVGSKLKLLMAVLRSDFRDGLRLFKAMAF